MIRTGIMTTVHCFETQINLFDVAFWPEGCLVVQSLIMIYDFHLNLKHLNCCNLHVSLLYHILLFYVR